MTYQEAMAAMQLVAEEEYGRHLRAQSADENAREDRSLEHLRREQMEMLD